MDTIGTESVSCAGLSSDTLATPGGNEEKALLRPSTIGTYMPLSSRHSVGISTVVGSCPCLLSREKVRNFPFY